MADHVVHQVHVQPAHHRADHIGQQQEQQGGGDGLHQGEGLPAAGAGCPVVVNGIGYIPHQLGGDHRAGNDDQAQKAAQDQPLPDGPGLQDQLAVDGQALAGGHFHFFMDGSPSHWPSPPVWER